MKRTKFKTVVLNGLRFRKPVARYVTRSGIVIHYDAKPTYVVNDRRKEYLTACGAANGFSGGDIENFILWLGLPFARCRWSEKKPPKQYQEVCSLVEHHTGSTRRKWHHRFVVLFNFHLWTR